MKGLNDKRKRRLLVIAVVVRRLVIIFKLVLKVVVFRHSTYTENAFVISIMQLFGWGHDYAGTTGNGAAPGLLTVDVGKHVRVELHWVEALWAQWLVVRQHLSWAKRRY